MFERTKTETGFIGPQRAALLLDTNKFPGQRPISMDHVQMLVGEMEAGRFTRGHIAIADHPKMGRILVNGQHQLTAGKLSGKPFFATVDTYKTTTNDDLWRLYATFDTHKSRSERNIMQGAKGLFEDPELRKTSNRILGMCGTALSFLGGGTSPVFASAKSKTQKVSLVQEYADDVANVRRYAGADCEALLRTGVAVAIIATFRKNKTAAGEFWDRVLIGDRLNRGTPQWHLNKALTEITFIDGTANGIMQHKKVYSLCVTWWNAYRTGQERKSVKLRAMKDAPGVEA